MENVWADVEIRTVEQDELGRSTFSARIAHIINDIPLGTESTVFALVSPWGSGKSSMLNLVETSIGGDVSTVRFSPWSVTDEAGLLSEFFHSLIAANDVLKEEEANQAVIALLKKSLPLLALIPAVGKPLVDTAQVWVGETNWDKQFKLVQEILDNENIKILVIVDDVDRLHSSEALTLLKVIRMLGRFRNVHYLLSYDHDALTAALAPSLGGVERAASYLEKIVQYPLAIPAAQQLHLNRMLDEGVQSLTDGMSIHRDAGSVLRFMSFYSDTLWQAFATVRSVKRFVTQASLYFNLLGAEEVDLGDFLALTFLRLHYPKVHDTLRLWKDELTGEGKKREYKYVSPTAESWQARYEKILGEGDTDLRIVASTMKYLFPSIGSHNGTREPPRIEHPEYFDRYFFFGIPEGDVSDAAVFRDLGTVYAWSPEMFDAEAFRETFTSAEEEVVYLSLKKAQRESKNLTLGDVREISELSEFLLWLGGIYTDRSLLRELAIWLADVIVLHPGFQNPPRLNRLLQDFHEPQLLRTTFDRVDTLRSLVRDDDELPDLSAMDQLKTAVGEVHSPRLLEVSISPPTPAHRETLLNHYWLLDAAEKLGDARSEVTGALREKRLNPIVVFSYFVPTVLNPQSGSYEMGELDLKLLMGLVDEDFLLEVDLTLESYPSSFNGSAELCRRADIARNGILSWRETRG